MTDERSRNGPAVGYTSYYVSTGSPCSNCRTTHDGACPPARLVERLRDAVHPELEVEAYVQARLHDERERIQRAIAKVLPAVV